MRSRYLFSILLIAFLFNSCKKENDQYFDPEEVLLTVRTDSWNDQYSNEIAFIVIENNESIPIYSEIVKGETTILKRGENISGNLINTHILYINTILEEPDWRLVSYYYIKPGKELELRGMYESGSKSQESGYVNLISFSDIPDFDIATRSAMTQRHCHTLNTLEVPCTDAFFADEYFYICLQQEDSAGYKLVKVPDVTEFVISLNDLNYNMNKIAISKNSGFPQALNIAAFGNEGTIEIFFLDYPYESIFEGDSVDVFVPVGLAQMTSFATTYFKQGTGQLQSAYYRDDVIATSTSYIDAGLSLNHDPGSFPVISNSSGDFDILNTIINIEVSENLYTWNISSPSGECIYKPIFPTEVLQAITNDFDIDEVLDNISYISVQAIEDSRFNSYDDAINNMFGITEYSEEAFTIFSDRIWLTKN